MREPFDGARSTLNTLFKMQIILGFILIVLVTFYLHRFNAFLGARERRVVLGQLMHFHILGLLMIVTYVADLQLWRRLWDLQTINPNTVMILNLWLSFNTFTLLCGLCTLWSLGQCVSEIETTAETSLLVGIDNYYESSEWKLLWDELQINKQCCGVHSFEDWQNIMGPCDENDTNRRKTRAPYSCCRKNDKDCYKMYAPDSQGNMPLLPLSVIYTNGCLQIFRQYIGRLVTILWCILLLALLLQLLVWFLVNFIVNNQTATYGQDFGSNDITISDNANFVCECFSCTGQSSSC